MTSRYAPNEAACPVPLEMLAALLRSGEERIGTVVLGLSPRQRALLGLYCFQRSHLRMLGLSVARHCGLGELGAIGGQVGELLFYQARAKASFDADPVPAHKRPVSLARL